MVNELSTQRECLVYKQVAEAEGKPQQQNSKSQGKGFIKASNPMTISRDA